MVLDSVGSPIFSSSQKILPKVAGGKGSALEVYTASDTKPSA